jgi:hypothetical protein
MNRGRRPSDAKNSHLAPQYRSRGRVASEEASELQTCAIQFNVFLSGEKSPDLDRSIFSSAKWQNYPTFS